MRKEILFLVDFDNLNDNQQQSLQLFIEKIVEKTILEYQLSNKFLYGSVRLYGGWYEQNNFTEKALEIRQRYQNHLTGILKVNEVVYHYCIDVALAQSLISNPDKDFWNTYRKKENHIRGFSFSSNAKNCVYPNSLMPALIQVIKHGKCPHIECPENCGEAFIYRSEQKMVDTLLTCDLIETTLIHPLSSLVVVVSSDDDFVPPLVLASNSSGCNVCLVHPKKNNFSRNLGVKPSCKIWEIE